jgi:hypothetical protein
MLSMSQLDAFEVGGSEAASGHFTAVQRLILAILCTAVPVWHAEHEPVGCGDAACDHILAVQRQIAHNVHYACTAC